jgi:hypothetical protein
MGNDFEIVTEKKLNEYFIIKAPEMLSIMKINWKLNHLSILHMIHDKTLSSKKSSFTFQTTIFFVFIQILFFFVFQFAFSIEHLSFHLNNVQFLYHFDSKVSNHQ